MRRVPGPPPTTKTSLRFPKSKFTRKLLNVRSKYEIKCAEWNMKSVYEAKPPITDLYHLVHSWGHFGSWGLLQ